MRQLKQSGWLAAGLPWQSCEQSSVICRWNSRAGFAGRICIRNLKMEFIDGTCILEGYKVY